ncbi:MULTISPECIES: bifunctional PIG-L family deacetylase/class I SAM-dependent methyltransferase [unclassified Leifsonia]|uniref:bifunctional PIG-L family deacetylase/class I SAM-dependent methyltransferase n=1 Tax=unclassified Leifsonia TaxID=2663824 RepID=UPI001F26E1B4|nr:MULTISPECIES: bifunctional PIG-L family deacetylase/class I SAM-dependent methyltransferase [unclassified Leifsonia]
MTFDSSQTGTLESEWAHADRWQRLPRYSGPTEHLVVLAAHPDDETLGAGGLIENAGRDGARITIVVATDGEGSHPASPTHTPWQLSRIRRREMRKAIDHLAPDAEIHHCEIADGRLSEHVDEVTACIVSVIEEAGTSATIVAPWNGDGHPDHRAAAEGARAAAEKTGSEFLEYPIWMWHWGRPDDDGLPWGDMVAIDLDPETRMAKSSALIEHLSQTAPLSDRAGDEAVIGVEMRSHFERPFEVFFSGRHGASPKSEPAGASNSATPKDGASSTDAASGTLGRDFFDDFYNGRDDPWGFETRWYEKRKRAIVLASLPTEQYGRTLEVGCSTGKLTEALAARSDSVLGVDIAAAPLRVAEERLAGSPHVELRQMQVPEEWPDGRFDLVVLSEVGYYWSPEDLDLALSRAIGALSEDGTLVACHWRHRVAEYPLSGDDVHTALARRTELVATVLHREEDFILEVFRRPPGVSVARETGLL